MSRELLVVGKRLPRPDAVVPILFRCGQRAGAFGYSGDDLPSGQETAAWDGGCGGGAVRGQAWVGVGQVGPIGEKWWEKSCTGPDQEGGRSGQWPT